MDQTTKKPNFLAITERWAMRVCLVWCVLSAVLGMFFVGVTEGIAGPLLTLLMTSVSTWMVKILFSVQKSNPFITRKIHDLAVMFFWGSGFCGVLYFIAQGDILQSSELSHSYFYLTAAIFPLGASLGAAKKWEQRFEYA